MLSSIISSGGDILVLLAILIAFLSALFISMPAHEFAHVKLIHLEPIDIISFFTIFLKTPYNEIRISKNENMAIMIIGTIPKRVY